MKCKIDAHIPTEYGLSCECGYFRKKKISLDDIIDKTKEVNDTIDKIQAKLRKILKDNL